ncbi:hypothetical protein OG426_18010 [Streptomyces canus]|uniref:effector-associated constant component EACC1 n=1 Tax=Streptomyces canus TaxID=58343 RepID=UPI002254F8C3|nr:hypothetical protein [Streptomyces canus]MCX4860560.1 hypothetical protein [Streptomyces canus]WSW34248.1 hypothetical protein OG426_18010 [Streptomyces canus]
MDITISVESDQSEPDLRSLEDWLLRDRRLRSIRFSRPEPVVEADDMGGSVGTILQASLAAGGAGAVLAGAVSVWLQNRVTQVRVRVRSPRGSVVVEAKGPGDPTVLIGRILEELPAAPADEAP